MRKAKGREGEEAHLLKRIIIFRRDADGESVARDGRFAVVGVGRCVCRYWIGFMR